MCVDSHPVPDRPNGNFLAKQSFAADRRKSQISLNQALLFPLLKFTCQTSNFARWSSMTTKIQVKLPSHNPHES